MTLTAALPTNPAEVRQLIREGRLLQPTAGMAPGRVQANLAILPRDMAFDFLLFCQRNPKPCPLLEVVEAGDVEPAEYAPGADLRTDVPLYRVYEHGEMTAEVEDVSEFWRDDLVSFLLGCSFSFETAMIRAGIPLKHIDQDKNVSMYITNIPAASAGAFSGPMVVSMRAVKREQVVRAVQVTSRFPATHGAPVHVGDPEVIGIKDSGQARLWRADRLQRRRSSRLLGVRRNPAGRGHGVPPAVHDHPRARTHVHHRQEGRRSGGTLAAQGSIP